MRLIYLLSFIILSLPLSVVAEERHGLEKGMLPAVEALWPILSEAIGDDRHVKGMTPKDFTEGLLGSIGSLGEPTPWQRRYLALDMAIRDEAAYQKYIKELPDALWNEKSKKMLNDWFQAESSTEVQKEAMLLLLVMIEPVPERTPTQK